MDASLKLFGVQLKGADRKTFRVSLLNDVLKLLRAGDWVDQYSPKGTLEGATVFEVGYAPGEDRFAYAEYKFASFVDAGKFSRIVRLIESKYGPPDTIAGDPKVREATLPWTFTAMTFVSVSRCQHENKTSPYVVKRESLATLAQNT